MIEVLSARRREAEIVLPRIDDRDQSMHTIYATDLAVTAERLLDAGGGSPRDLAAASRTLRLGPDMFDEIENWRRSFFSINTPEDLEEARRILGEDP